MIAVPKRAIGSTALETTELGFGGAGLGNLYAPVRDDVAQKTVAAALAAGIGYFDTAPYYGFGLSERRLGDALRSDAGAVISTKVGRLLEPDASVVDNSLRHGFRSLLPFEPVFDYSYDGILKSVEQSLQRLGRARVEILYVHDIGALTHAGRAADYFDQLTRGGGFRALEELREQQVVQAFGVGVNEIEACLEVLRVTDIDAILLAGRYTLLEQDALRQLLPLCERRCVSVVIGGVYNSGILATGTEPARTLFYNYEPAPKQVIERVRNIEEICAAHAVPLKAAALQFPLAHPVVASVIPGLTSPQQVDETLRLYQLAIPGSLWAELKSSGLLDRDSPVPGEQQ